MSRRRPMGSPMHHDLLIPPPEAPHRSPPLPSRLGRILLGLLRAALRLLLVVVLDLLIMPVRFVLWFRRVLFWLGLLSLASSAFDFAAARTWLIPVVAIVAGVAIIALARASLLLDDRLRFWQLQLHAWAQGWPVTRYAFTVLPPRR